MRERYLLATMVDYEVEFATIYFDCKVKDKIQDGAVIGQVVSGWSGTRVVRNHPSFADELSSVLAEDEIMNHRAVWASLADGVTSKMCGVDLTEFDYYISGSLVFENDETGEAQGLLVDAREAAVSTEIAMVSSMDVRACVMTALAEIGVMSTFPDHEEEIIPVTIALAIVAYHVSQRVRDQSTVVRLKNRIARDVIACSVEFGVSQGIVDLTHVNRAADEAVDTMAVLRSKLSVVNDIGDAVKNVNDITRNLNDKFENVEAEANQVVKEMRLASTRVTAFLGDIPKLLKSFACDMSAALLPSFIDIISRLIGFIVDLGLGVYDNLSKPMMLWRKLHRLLDIFGVGTMITTFVGLVTSIHRSSTMLSNVAEDSLFGQLTNLDEPMDERTGELLAHQRRIADVVSAEPGDVVEEDGSAEGLPEPDAAAALVALAGLVVGVNFTKNADMKKYKEITQFFNALVPASKNVMKTVSWIVSCLPECLQKWVDYICPASFWALHVSEEGEFGKWLTEANTFLSENSSETDILYNIPKQDLVENLYNRGFKLVKEGAIELKSAEGGKFYQITMKTYDAIAKLYKAVYEVKSDTPSRVTPYVIWLNGTPGVGKSSLSSELAKRLGTGINRSNLIYYRNAQDPHWNKYYGQYCVVVDDMCQMSSNTQDVQEFFQMTTNTKFIPPMASLDNAVLGKKGTEFQSKLLILSSNQSFPTPTGVSSTEAFYRRRQMLVTVRAPMRNGVPDMDQFQPDFSHLRLDILDSLDKDKAHRHHGLTFDQFLDIVKVDYNKHMEREKRRMESLNENADIVEAMRDLPADLEIMQPAEAGEAQGDTVVLPGMQLDTTQVAHGAAPGFIQRDGKFIGVQYGPYTHKPGKTKVENFAAVLLKSTGGTKYVNARVIAQSERDKYLAKAKLWMANNPRIVNVLKIASLAALVMVPFEVVYSAMKKKQKKLEEFNTAEGKEEALRARRFFEEQREIIMRNPIHTEEARGKYITKIDAAIGALSEAASLPTDRMHYRDLDAGVVKRMRNIMVAEAAGVSANYSGDERKNQMVRQTRERIVNIQRNMAEASSDPNATSIMYDCIVPQMFSIKVGPLSMCAFGVRGSVVLAPLHLFCGSEDGYMVPVGTEILLKGPYDRDFTTFKFDPTRLSVIKRLDGGEQDAVLYNFGNRMQSQKDRVDLFATEEEILKLRRFQAEMALMDVDGTGKALPRIKDIDEITPQEEMHALKYGSRPEVDVDGPNAFRLTHGWRYTASTKPGFCGGVILAHHTGIIGKIVGIHVAAGSKGYNFGEKISKESINKSLATFAESGMANGLPDAGFATNSIENARVLPDGNFMFVGTLPNNMVPRAAEKSTLEPSLLYEKVFLSTVAPAPLTDRDPRIEQPLPPAPKIQPIVVGTNKFGKSTKAPEPVEWKQAVDYVRDMMLAMKRGNINRVLSEHETINGVSHEPFLQGMDMSTSPGFPYVISRPKKFVGKEYLFSGTPGSYRVNDDYLRTTLDKMESMAKQSMRIENVWVGTLKDEKRLIAKNKLGKTRLFTVGPVHFTMMVRKYCLAFVACFYNNQLNIPSGVGMNPESCQWKEMYDKLASTSHIGFDGDFSNWDGTLIPEVMEAVNFIVNEWYGDEHYRVREVLFNEMTHTQQSCLNVIFYKRQGNPSGNPMTVVINTIGNMLYMAYCWFRLAPQEMKDEVLFRNNVTYFAYGDDNIVTVAPSCASYYNMITVGQELDRIGIDYTPTSKIGVREAIRLLRDMSFLKRKFRFHGSQVYPLMDEHTLHELVNWVRKSDDPQEALSMNIASCMRMAFFYGYPYYKEFRDSIMQVAREQRVQLDIPTYQYFNQYYSVHNSLPSWDFGDGEIRVEIESGKSQADVAVAPPTEESAGIVAPMEGITVTKAAGVVLDQQAPMPTQTLQLKPTTKQADMMIADAVWDMNKAASKPTVLKTLTWDVTKMPGEDLFSAHVPHDLIINVPNHLAFRNYHWWRGKAMVHVQVKGNPFQQGLLYVGFVPMCQRSLVKDWHLQHQAAATCVPYILLDPSVSAGGTLEMPYVSPRHYIDLINEEPMSTSYNLLGTLFITPFNQLRAAATGRQSATVAITVWFEESEFKIIRAIGVCGGSLKVSRKPMHLMGADENDDETGTAQGGYQSISYDMRNVKFAAKSTIGGTATNDEIGRGSSLDANASGLDKPNLHLEPPMVVTSNSLGYFNNSQQITNMERFCLQPGGMKLATKETFGAQFDEMDYRYLLKKVTRQAGNLEWSTIDMPGHVLYVEEMCPLPEVINGKTKQGDVVIPTLFDYMSAKHSFWMGTIRYKIQIVGSNFHYGRLFFSTHYGRHGTSATSLDISEITSQYGVYLDMSPSKREWVIDVPFYAPYKLRVPNGPEDVDKRDPYSMGVWALTIINELSGPTDVSPSVQINLWRGGGDDFQLYYFGHNNNSLIATTVPLTTSFEVGYAQASSELERASPNGNIQVAAPSASHVKFDEGERYENVQDVLKRFTRGHGKTFLQPPFKIDNVNYNKIVNNYSIAFNTDTVFHPQSDTTALTPPYPKIGYKGKSGALSWFGMMYRGYFGSMRYKVSCASSGKNTRVLCTFTPDHNLGFNADNLMSMVDPLNHSSFKIDPATPANILEQDDPGFAQNIGQSLAPIASSEGNAPAVFFEIPFATQYKYLLAPKGKQEAGLDSTDLSGVGVIGVRVEAIPEVVLQGDNIIAQPMYFDYSTYVSGGDEFRFGLLLGPPFLRVSSPAMPPDNYATV